MNALLHWIQTLPWWAPGALTECLWVAFVVALYPFSYFKWSNYVGNAIMWVCWGSFFAFYGMWFARHDSAIVIPSLIITPIGAVVAFVLIVRHTIRTSPQLTRKNTFGGKILQFPGAKKRRSAP